MRTTSTHRDEWTNTDRIKDVNRIVGVIDNMKNMAQELRDVLTGRRDDHPMIKDPERLILDYDAFDDHAKAISDRLSWIKRAMSQPFTLNASQYEIWVYFLRPQWVSYYKTIPVGGKKHLARHLKLSPRRLRDLLNGKRLPTRATYRSFFVTRSAMLDSNQEDRERRGYTDRELFLATGKQNGKCFLYQYGRWPGERDQDVNTVRSAIKAYEEKHTRWLSGDYHDAPENFKKMMDHLETLKD